MKAFLMLGALLAAVLVLVSFAGPAANAGVIPPACAAQQDYGMGLNLPPEKAATTAILRPGKTRTVARSKSVTVTRSAAVQGPLVQRLLQRRHERARESGPGACQPAACTPNACGPMTIPAPPVPTK